MKQFFLALSFVLIGSLTAFAQDGRISGTVVDDAGEPVIGATVMVKGTKQGVVTDVDGKFTIKASKGNTLVVTYIGYDKREVKAQNGMKVTMYSADTSLDEVVVTGIMKQDKRLFTGATSKVDADKAKLDGIADITRSLEGRVAGVQLENVSSTFGTAPKIRVRGATSIYGSSSPLWVVDGVIMEDAVQVSSDDLSSGDASTLIANAIAGLNADDIESFQVLKDGSATSIYGARAMAGVIVITTKKGKAGRSSVNYTGEFTYRMKPSYSDYNICNSQEQMGIYKEMAAKGWLTLSQLANSSSSGIYGKMYSLIDTYNSTDGQFGLAYTDAAMNAYLQEAELRNTDWFDLLFHNNVVQTHSVSVSTGTDKANLYTSVSVYDDPGWTDASSVQRYTATMNATYNFSKKLSVTLRTNASYRNQEAPGTLNQSVDVVSGEVTRDFDINPFSYALNTSRCLDPNEYYTRNYADFNIFHELENNYIDIDVYDVKFQGELNWKPLKHVEVSLLGSYRTMSTTREHIIKNSSNQAEAYRAGVDDPNIMYNNTYLYTDPDDANSLPVSVMPTGGINIMDENSVAQLDFRGTVRYDNTWNDTHIFNALGGWEANRADYDSRHDEEYGIDYDNGRIQNLPTEFYKQAKEEGLERVTFSKSWNRRLAYFGFLSYSYKGRYTISVTGRYDGSNQLGKATSSRWLPTWNVSGAWNAHEEEWFRKWSIDHGGWLSHGTIRLSYSLVGEQTTASNANAIYRSGIVWRPQGDQQESYIYISQLANEDLTYEKKKEFNLGVDFGFFNNRINLITDWYWRDNYDLMGYVNTQGSGGEVQKFANVASMRSHGIEATLSTHNIQSGDWDWTTDLTFAYTKTTITDVLSQANVINLVYNSGANIRKGYPQRALFSIPFVGLNDEGIPMFINQDGEITTTDINFQEYENLDFLVYEGPTDPTTTGGLNNTVRWKNWRLNVFLTYSFGNKIRLDPVFSSYYSDMTAMPKEFKNRWVMPGDENLTTIPTIASLRQYYNDNTLSYAYNAYNYSTERVADGGFIRLKDISLTYDFSRELISKIGLNSASLKFDVTNICLLYADDKLNGQDPEFVNSGGVATPISRQFTLTVRLGL